MTEQKQAKMRKFNTQEYVNGTVSYLNELAASEGFDSVMVGVSGGTNSAAALMLCLLASAQEGSPIKRVYSSFIEQYCSGTHRVAESRQRVSSLLSVACHYEALSHDSADISELFKCADIMHGTYGKPHLHEVLAVELRTAMLNYQLAIAGSSCRMICTADLDNIYLGLAKEVGISPLASLHKSQVRSVATYLSVPDVILNTEPTPNGWDGSTYVDRIGAPYWFVEEMIESERPLTDFDLSDKRLSRMVELIKDVHKGGKLPDMSDKLFDTLSEFMSTDIRTVAPMEFVPDGIGFDVKHQISVRSANYLRNRLDMHTFADAFEFMDERTIESISETAGVNIAADMVELFLTILNRIKHLVWLEYGYYGIDKETHDRYVSNITTKKYKK